MDMSSIDGTRMHLVRIPTGVDQLGTVTYTEALTTEKLIRRVGDGLVRMLASAQHRFVTVPYYRVEGHEKEFIEMVTRTLRETAALNALHAKESIISMSEVCWSDGGSRSMLPGEARIDYMTTPMGKWEERS